MPVIEVAANHPEVADYRNLTDVQWRQRHEPDLGFFLAEGHKVISRALAAGYQPRSILTTSKWLADLQAITPDQVPIYLADELTLKGIVGYRLHRGALAAFQRPTPVPVADILSWAQSLVILEDLVDHTNVGLIMRTAAALGIDAVLVSPRCADPWYRRSVKTSMGAVLTLPWTVIADWPESMSQLHTAGFTTLALTPAVDAVDIASLPSDGKFALILGTEGPGLAHQTMAQATLRAQIPVTDRVDSLNVAAAAAIAMYTLVARPRG